MSGWNKDTQEGPACIEIPAEIPDELKTTRTVAGTTFVAGRGPAGPVRVMLIGTALFEEEAVTEKLLPHANEYVKEKPAFLKDPAGIIMSDLAEAAGMPKTEWYYTAAVPWLLPRAKRTRPSKEILNAAKRLLYRQIAEKDPEIIVCLGKPVFDLLSDTKFKLADITGGWFNAKLAGRSRRLYPMIDHQKLVNRPETVEVFKKDFREVKRMLDKIDGVWVEEYPIEDRVIKTAAELEEYVQYLEDQDARILSVDCEWHGMNHIDGELRSIQICHTPGKRAYVYFRAPDKDRTYTFDVTYREAGRILGRWLDRPEVKYVGHHIAADLVWMHHVLGLKWYRKTKLDTEFAQQCVDEYAELGLERLGMTYTTLGRWDHELTVWSKNKKNSKLVEDGYGHVPDDILIPYSLNDVDAVMRAWPAIWKQLEDEPGGKALEYYTEMLNPFVTDVFTNFSLEGLPVDLERVDILRDLYQYCRRELNIEFRELVAKEADMLLMGAMINVPEADPHEAIRTFKTIRTLVLEESNTDEAYRLFKQFVGADHLFDMNPFYKHWLQSPAFNINSVDHMRRWLFEVKKYEPVKSTAQRDKGIPSLPWDKIKQFPEERQKEFNPSADKQSIKILADTHKDPLLQTLMRFKNVDTVCKSFLGEPVEDDDGNIVKEKGIHAYIASNGRLVGMFSTTETGRPRSWKPNTLNLPSWVNAAINDAIKGVLVKKKEQGTIPAKFEKFVEGKIPSVRSIVTAPPGWCVPESDYQTAELRGWAFISGDQNMIDLVTKPDVNFAKVRYESLPIGKDGSPNEDAVCRLSFPPEIVGDYEHLKMTYTEGGKEVKRFTEEDLERDANGDIVLTKQDLHWGLAEIVHKAPREVLVKKRDRGAAKVGNFQTAFGCSENTLERSIEADTGIKPEPGTGAALLEALEKRQTRAFAFMQEMEEKPVDPGYIVAASGRVRHFYLHPVGTAGISQRQRDGVLSSLSREARNFQCQESVAATAMRAAVALLAFKMRFNLKGWIAAVLYDSEVTMCPAEERKLWFKAHELFMYLANGWMYDKRVLRYPIDSELNKSWSYKITAEELSEIEAVSTDVDYIKPAERWVDNFIEFLRDDEEASLGAMKLLTDMLSVS